MVEFGVSVGDGLSTFTALEGVESGEGRFRYCMGVEIVNLQLPQGREGILANRASVTGYHTSRAGSYCACATTAYLSEVREGLA